MRYLYITFLLLIACEPFNKDNNKANNNKSNKVFIIEDKVQIDRGKYEPFLYFKNRDTIIQVRPDSYAFFDKKDTLTLSVNKLGVEIIRFSKYKNESP